MAPNLEIIVLAFLYGSFIACVLLLVVFLIVIVMLLAFSLTLISIVVIDLYTLVSICSSYFETVEADLLLGCVLILCMLLRYAIAGVSASQPWLERTVPKFKVKGRHAMARISAVLAKTRRL